MLLAVAGTCPAQDAWRGIWEGTIGQAPVRICLDGKDGEDSRYYYLKYGKDILLRQSGEGEGSWIEESNDSDKPGGSWDLAAEGSDSMRGIWMNTQSGSHLPVLLKRTTLPLDGAPSLCEAEYFFKPVADAQKLVPGAVRTFGRHSYQELSARVQQRAQSEYFAPGTIVLRGYGAGGAAVNQLLQERLRKRLARARDTRMDGLGESTEEVVWLSDRWLSLRETEWPNGRGAAGISRWFETWDLPAGAKVDLWRWFNQRGGKWQEEAGEQVFRPAAALRKAIGPGGDNGGDPECKRQDKSWGAPRLAPGGIEFEQGYGPCLDVATLSYEALQPFLNEEGLRQVAALQREAQNAEAAGKR